MNVKLRVLSLIGVLALMASSMAFAGNQAIAQSSIETSITVENSEPPCTDATPSSVSIPGATNLGDRTPGGASNSTQYRGLTVNMYVNTCSEYGWAVTATVTDFSMGSFSHPGSNLWVKGSSFGTIGNVAYDSDWTTVPGTTGLSWSTAVPFSGSAGAGLWSPSVNISSGSAGSTGAMHQALELQLRSIPWTLPAGDYSAQLTLTFTPTGP